MDRIFISKMTVPVIIGTLPHERKKKQEITLDLAIGCDMRKAGKSDNLFDAVDYSAVEKKVYDFTAASSYFLLEALAENIAEIILAFDGVFSAQVHIEKPAAAAFSKSIAVEIFREKQ